ncbi:MAG: S-layer homology domain-containing protein, partial [Selenomonadaceae bacterium]|nr:S-layer homology domain-containing protein [Selenomonadaceae bacterium]
MAGASLSSTAFAASADSFTDVPKDHWAYQALDYLAKEGVIDGMGDSTFQGGRTMTRYEMASIVAKAMQKKDVSFGDQAVLDKLASEYKDELATLNKKVDANTQAIKALNAKTDKFKVWGMVRAQVGDDNGLVADGHNATYNNRFYMDFEGAMKINDRMTARFTVEKNAHYRDKEYAKSKIQKIVPLTRRDGTADFVTLDNPISGINKDSILGDDNHNGSISNIWVEMQLGPKHDWYTNIGRKWNGIGMQNLMLGGQVDGIATYHPIEGGHGWWLSAQYWKPSADWTNVSGTDKIKETFDADGKHAGWDTSGVTYNTHRAPVVGSLDFWGPLGKYIDLNLAYSRVVDHTTDVGNSADGYYTGAKNFYGVDVKAKLFKDFAVTGS